MRLQDAARFALRIVATSCVVLWILEERSQATRCPPTSYVGEIWELDRIGAPHTEDGEARDTESSTWRATGTLENYAFLRIQAEVLTSGSLDMEGV